MTEIETWLEFDNAVIIAARIKGRISAKTFTRVKTDVPFSVSNGYNGYVRRSNKDFLNWMDQTDELILFLSEKLRDLPSERVRGK